MRILLWSSSYGQTIGGGPVLAPLFVRALVERGHEIVVVTDRRPATLPEHEQRDGAKVQRFAFSAALAGDFGLLARTQAAVSRLYADFRPDLVHIFAPGYADFFHHRCPAAARQPLVLTLHDSFASPTYAAEALIGRDIRAADRIAACSASVLTTLQHEMPGAAGRATVVRNALPAPAPSTARPESARLFFAGRLIHKKGVDVLIDALSRLLRTHSSVRLDIAGDGAERSALRDQVTRLGISGAVRFLGVLDHPSLYAAMSRAAAVVVPSRIEPFGLVALEAAQAGRPVIASAVGGLSEVVVDGQTGLLVPADDPGQLADALAGLLDDPQRADALGAAARLRAAREFDWSHYVAQYESIYRQVHRERQDTPAA